MKPLATILLALALALPGTLQGSDPTIVAQVVLHEDGRRTEHVRNPEARTIEAFTRDTAGVLVKRELFRLRSDGQPAQCHIYDGSGNLLFRALYRYDEHGRKLEEASYNRAGRMVRRVIYRYDEQGRPLQPIAQNIPDPSGSAPIIAPVAPQLTPEGLVAQPQPESGRGN